MDPIRQGGLRVVGRELGQFPAGIPPLQFVAAASDVILCLDVAWRTVFHVQRQEVLVQTFVRRLEMALVIQSLSFVE